MQNFEHKNKKTIMIKLLMLPNFLFINFLLIYFHFKNKKFDDNKILVFTFWEPRTNVPGYLQLCVNTWKKNLPNSTITILDYSNLHEYLSFSIISKILCKKMLLFIQTDAIRVAILEKYGGIWLDMDIIITNYRFLINVFKNDLAFFGSPGVKFPAIGFIYAAKNSLIIKEWLKNIIKRVSLFKRFTFRKNKDYDKLSNLNKWNYLGNEVLSQILIKKNKKEYKIFDWVKMNAIPERNAFHFRHNMRLSEIKEAYHKFYFYPGNPQKIIYNNPGIIILHNSWTPKKYKSMSQTEFLKQNIMLSSLFKKLLFK